MVKDIDTIETITTDKGTYKIHTDCYNAIKKETQKELLLEIFDKGYLWDTGDLLEFINNRLKELEETRNN